MTADFWESIALDQVLTDGLGCNGLPFEVSQDTDHVSSFVGVKLPPGSFCSSFDFIDVRIIRGKCQSVSTYVPIDDGIS